MPREASKIDAMSPQAETSHKSSASKLAAEVRSDIATMHAHGATHLETILEIDKQVEESEDKIMNKIDSISSELRDKQQTDHTSNLNTIRTVEENLSKKIDTQSENIASHFDNAIDKLDTKWDTKFTRIDVRVTGLEKWRWLIVGGGIVVLWVVIQFLSLSIRNWADALSALP